MEYSVARLEEMGFKLAMYSTAAVLAVQKALTDVYSTIYEHGHTQPMQDRMSTFTEYRTLLDEPFWSTDAWFHPLSVGSITPVSSSKSQIFLSDYAGNGVKGIALHAETASTISNLDDEVDFQSNFVI